MDWTADNLRWFFLQPPPRPSEETLLRTALNVFFPKLVRWLFLILPVLMLCISGIMLFFLIRNSDLKSEWRLLTESPRQTSGKVLAIEEIKSSKGSITYAYTYEFEPAEREGSNDPPIKGLSFSGNRVAAPGQAVLIEYLADDPHVSRIKGGRANFISWQVFLVIPFVGIITAILPWGIIAYRKRFLQRLITYGVLASATIEKIQPGAKGTLVVHLHYTVEGFEVKAKTNTGGGRTLHEWFSGLQQAGREVLVLVDPQRPKKLFLVELLLRSGATNAPVSSS